MESDRKEIYSDNLFYMPGFAGLGLERKNLTMRGLNKVSLIGHLGKDPEVKTLAKEIRVAKFSLATTESYKDEKGKHHSVTDWHTIILWKGLADVAEKYLFKGSMIYVEGKLKTRSFEDKSGQKKYVAEIIGDHILLLDKASTKS